MSSGGWRTYTGEKFGSMLKYPSDATIIGADPDASEQFVGPVVGNEHWPWFLADRYDSQFFRGLS